MYIVSFTNHCVLSISKVKGLFCFCNHILAETTFVKNWGLGDHPYLYRLFVSTNNMLAPERASFLVEIKGFFEVFNEPTIIAILGKLLTKN